MKLKELPTPTLPEDYRFLYGGESLATADLLWDPTNQNWTKPEASLLGFKGCWLPPVARPVTPPPPTAESAKRAHRRKRGAMQSVCKVRNGKNVD